MKMPPPPIKRSSKNFFMSMLEQGIYIAPSQFETLFVSAAHTDADFEKTVDAAKIAFGELV